LTCLEDRTVPAVIDLTTRGAMAEVAGGIVQQVAMPFTWESSRPIVRMNGKGIEQGYNTDARPVQFNETPGRNVTRAVTVGEIPRRTVNEELYREFRLDINQKILRPRLSVDEIKIFLGDSPNLTGYHNGKLAGIEPIFDLDRDGDVSIRLNANLNLIGNNDDMVLLVPEAAFAGATAGTYVYLYSKMGGLPGAAANGGHEQWGIRSDGGGAPIVPPPPPPQDPPPPPPATASIRGTVYFDMDASFDYDPDIDYGLEGERVELWRMDSTGQYVFVAFAITDVDGHFSFDGLQAGVYSLRQIQPENYQTASNTIGNAGGEFDSEDFDIILGIQLEDDMNASGYLFGEQPLIG
jgi:hypothetical protein